MTDRRNGLAAFDELADEGDRVGVNPELVGIHRAAREKQGVIVGDRGVRDQPVNGEGACCLQIVLTRLNLTVMDRQHLGLCASPLQCLAGLFELDSLDPVGGEDGDSPAL